MILTDHLYVLLYNLIYIGQTEAYQHLKNVLNQASITLETLKVKPVFHCNSSDRIQMM